MANPTPPPAGDASRSRAELVAALPEVRRLAKQMYEAVMPAMVTEHTASESHAIFQAATAVIWIADALDAPGRLQSDASRSGPHSEHLTEVERLTEATHRVSYVAQAVQERLAEVQSMDELAADEQHRRELGCETEVIIDQAVLDVALPDGSSTTITLDIEDGRVTWTAPAIDLAPVDGQSQLAVAGLLAQLGETLTRALPEPASGSPR